MSGEPASSRLKNAGAVTTARSETASKRRVRRPAQERPGPADERDCESEQLKVDQRAVERAGEAKRDRLESREQQGLLEPGEGGVGEHGARKTAEAQERAGARVPDRQPARRERGDGGEPQPGEDVDGGDGEHGRAPGCRSPGAAAAAAARRRGVRAGRPRARRSSPVTARAGRRPRRRRRARRRGRRSPRGRRHRRAEAGRRARGASSRAAAAAGDRTRRRA